MVKKEPKRKQVETKVEHVCIYEDTFNSIISRLEAIEAKLESLTKPVKTISINKPEQWYESQTKPEAYLSEERSMRMNYQDKLISVKNATKILPPNMVVEGRHTKENVSAICGFFVDDEMLDEVYKEAI